MDPKEWVESMWPSCRRKIQPSPRKYKYKKLFLEKKNQIDIKIVNLLRVEIMAFIAYLVMTVLFLGMLEQI